MTEIEKESEKQFGIGKTKIGLAVALVLVVILATSTLVLLMEVNSLQKNLGEPRFDFYYVVPAEQKFGVYDLEDDLYGLYWLYPYEEGVFDCSEMSAYLEWYLENLGWNTIIIVGDSPFGSGRHAWLLVECEQGKYMPVESTNIEIVWWEDPYFDNYFIYDHELETIRDAMAYDETDFDWWK